MKIFLSITLLFLVFGYPNISHSVTNQELMDKLDDLEWEQQMRDQQRRSDKNFDRLMELQRQQSVPRSRTDPRDIFLKNHVLIYSTQDERVYMNQMSSKTKTNSSVFYLVEYLKPNYFDRRLRYLDVHGIIDCVNNNINDNLVVQMDENFQSIEGRHFPYNPRKITSPKDKSIKAYMCY